MRDLLQAPPQNLEAERAVLGACFLDPVMIDLVAEKLAPESFYKSGHALVWRTMLDLRSRRVPVDKLTVIHALKEQDLLDSAGGPVEIDALTNVVPTPSNASYYADLVGESAQRRALREACDEGFRLASETHSPVAEVAARIERSVLEAAARRSTRKAKTIGEVLGEALSDLERVRAGGAPGLPTGIRGLDDMTHGLRPGDLTIIAARPAMGKSTLALNLLANVVLSRARSTPRPAVLVSFEMIATELATNLMALVARVDSHKLRGGRQSHDEDDRLVTAAEAIASSPLELVGCETVAGETVSSLCSRARRWKAEKKLELLVVDYLQLVRVSERRERSREQEVAEVSRELRALAGELRVPIVALAQLNRQVENRNDHRPRLADLRESGAIEADASLVLLLHREAYYQSAERALAEGLTNTAELLVAKNRYGPAGSVPLFFDRACGLFEDGESPAPRSTRGGQRRGHDHAAAAAGDA